MTRYRIRWANVRDRRGWLTRMCIAERKTWLGWWPVANSDWRHHEEKAERDIQDDKALRAPLPAPKEMK